MTRKWQQSSVGPKAGRWAAIYATMNSKGVIHISRRTYQRLGEPEAFNLLYDRMNSTIGMQPVGKNRPNAYPAIRKGPRDAGFIVRAFGFAKEFQIELNETVRFNAAEIDEDGVLVLDLRKIRSAAKPKKVARLAGETVKLHA